MIAPVLFQYITFWTYILFAFMNVLFIPMVVSRDGGFVSWTSRDFVCYWWNQGAKFIASEREHYNYDNEKKNDVECDIAGGHVGDNKPRINHKEEASASMSDSSSTEESEKWIKP